MCCKRSGVIGVARRTSSSHFQNGKYLLAF